MLPGALAIWLGVATHASFVAFAAAASAPGCQTAQQRVHRCGTAKPSKVLMEAHKELAKNKDHKTHSIDRNEVMNNIGLFAHAAPSKGVVKSKEHETRDIAPDEVINIDLYAHVVMSDEKNQSLASDTMVNKQLEMLNEAYKKSNFHFNLKKIVRVNNAAWALGQDGSEMRRQLRQGDQKTVNVFFLEKLQGGAIGLAQLPDRWARLGLDSDYVNIQVNTITGSSSKSNSQGITLVHEIGHWLGLLHPDEYGCDMGDFIDDTPAMAYIYHNCTAADSCPGEKYPGEDPIHNYMSDGPDSCLTEFTPGQTKRMRIMWEMFRLSPNAKEISWKDDCLRVLSPLYSECLDDKSKKQSACVAEFQENMHKPCGQLAPNKGQECLDRFAPYKDKCKSDSCKVNQANRIENYCAAVQSVIQGPTTATP